jgi:hypothetical protein
MACTIHAMGLEALFFIGSKVAGKDCFSILAILDNVKTNLIRECC